MGCGANPSYRKSTFALLSDFCASAVKSPSQFGAIACIRLWPAIGLSTHIVCSTGVGSRQPPTPGCLKRLAEEGYEPVLKNSRYCFLKRRSNLTIRQATKLRDVLTYDLKSVHALALKESLDAFWQYERPIWAGWFFKKWCTRAMRSKLAPTKKFVGTLRNHEDLLMKYFKAGKLHSSGIVQGLNVRINLCMGKAYGYRSLELLQTPPYHTHGDMPGLEFTHKFC